MRIDAVRPLCISDLPSLSDTTLDMRACRQMRAPLLAAFDVYKSNVAYGILAETAAEHKAVALWYRHLLDLEPAAFTAVPAAVAQYVTGEVMQA